MVTTITTVIMASKPILPITAITVSLLRGVSLWWASWANRDRTPITGDHSDHTFSGVARINGASTVSAVIAVIGCDLTKITDPTREKGATVIGVIGTRGLA